MKNLIAFLAFVMMSQAHAQAPQLVQYAQPQQQQQQQQQAPQQAQADAVANAPSSSPIYILNNQKFSGYQSATQGAVQEAPTTVVQENPVKVSVSETIRKERTGAEAATEDGIVVTLEKARMEDEIRRRERFNLALAPAVQPIQIQQSQNTATSVVIAPGAGSVVSNANATSQQTQVQKVEEEEVVVVAPRPSKRKKVVIEDETREDEHSEYRTEVRAAIESSRLAPINMTSYYIAGLVGTANYNTANIRSKLSSGFSLGMVTPERFVFEGSFMYGQSEIDNIAGANANGLTYDIAQYNFSAAAKYQILPGKLRPTVGAIASYTRRSYSVASASSYSGGCGYCGTQSGGDLGSTNALDAGLEAGLDLALTNSFSIGADFRYLWNIATQDSNNSGYRTQANPNYRNVPVVEELTYYIASVSAKFTF